MSSNDPFTDALGAFSTLAGGLARAPGLGTSPLDALMMQAHLASSATLLRSGQRAAQSWLDYSKEAAGAALPVQVDAARAHLRRLAEIAADEARQIEQQLRGLDERARELVAPAEPEAEPVRRAEIKR